MISTSKKHLMSFFSPGSSFCVYCKALTSTFVEQRKPMPQLCLMGFLCSIQACCLLLCHRSQAVVAHAGHTDMRLEYTRRTSEVCNAAPDSPKTNIDLLRCYVQDCVNLFQFVAKCMEFSKHFYLSYFQQIDAVCWQPYYLVHQMQTLCIEACFSKGLMVILAKRFLFASLAFTDLFIALFKLKSWFIQVNKH